MQRIFLSEIEFQNKILIDNNFHHQKNVLRIKIDDVFEAVYNNQLMKCRVTNINKDNLSFEITELINTKDRDYKFTLVQGIAKADKNDEIIKHSTELGVDEIILANMNFSIAKINNSNIENKLERFNKIAMNAATQAHRNNIPEVKIIDLKKIDYNKYDICLLLDEEEAKKENPNYINNIDLKNKNNILFVIGPEGGISNDERNYLLDKGFLSVAITKNILRTETASLAILAMLDYKMRD